MPTIILRETTSLTSPGATAKGTPLTNNEVDNNFSNLNIAVGVITNLTTSNTGNIVVSVNELNSKIAVINSNTGLKTSLTTSNTTNLVSAINEINASSGVVANTYGGVGYVSAFTVNAKGRITSAANVVINDISNFANTGAGGIGFTLTTSGNSVYQANLSTSGVTAATYGGNSTFAPQILVDEFGRVTSASNVTVGMSLENDTSTNSTTFYPVLASIATGILTSANVSSTKLYYNPNSGTLYVTALTQLSDQDTKTNVVQITNATSKLITLNCIEFDWVDNGIKSSGFLAQDVEIVYPHLVSSSDHGVKSINYSGIIPYLVQTIKELEERVKQLETINMP